MRPVDLDGMFAGQFPPEEYEPHLASGVMRLSYEGITGFMGLATLRLQFLVPTEEEVIAANKSEAHK